MEIVKLLYLIGDGCIPISGYINMVVGYRGLPLPITVCNITTLRLRAHLRCGVDGKSTCPCGGMVKALKFK